MLKMLDALHTRSQRASRNLCLSVLVLCLADFIYFKLALKGASSSVRCLHIIVACMGMWSMYVLCSRRPINEFGETLRLLSYPFIWGAATYAAVASVFLVALEHDLRLEYLSISLIFHALTFGLSAGTVEEILFRGLLLSALLKMLGKRVAHPLIIAAIIEVMLFTLSHYNAARLKTYYFVPFAWGTYLTLLTLRSGTLWPAIGAHAGYNTIQVISTGVNRPGFAKIRGVFSVDPSLLPKFFILLSLAPVIGIAIIYRAKIFGCVLKMMGRDSTVNDGHVDVSRTPSLIAEKEFAITDPTIQ